ncbi:zinc finger protein weckle-like [Drosophila innubila]|uniref:zinc finger protein weckle-like n=1 Tax=Drosophila innubila TaxID=198719 RepID=UPI00148BE8B3|nr:zinc finger protein weckle-like [Drosophila innubila]
MIKQNKCKVPWLNWCRLCVKDDVRGNINVYASDDATALNSAITKYFDVQMRQEDKLSGVLCKECYDLITKLPKFAERVNKVQTIFKTLQRSKSRKQLDVEALRKKYGLQDVDWMHIIKPVLENENNTNNQIEEKEEDLMAVSNQENNETQTLEMNNNNSPAKIQCRRLCVRLTPFKLPKTDSPGNSKEKRNQNVDIVDNETNVNPDLTENDEFNETSCAGIYGGLECLDHTIVSMPIEIEMGNNDAKDYTKKNSIKRLRSGQFKKLSENDSDQVPLLVKKEYCEEPNAIDIFDSDNPIPTEHELHMEAGCSSLYGGLEFLLGVESPANSSVESENLLEEDNSDNSSEESNYLLEYSSDSYSDDEYVATKKYKYDKEKKNAKFECEVCGKRYYVLKPYEKHLKHGCGKNKEVDKKHLKHGCVKNKELDKKHLKHGSGKNKEMDKNMYCELCKKTLSSLSYMRKHIKSVHSTDNPHACDVCSKHFRTIAHLNNHRVVHSEDWKIKCDVCGAPFSNSKNLKRHLVSHLKLRPYVCNYCDKSFSKNAVIRAHILKHHPEVKDDRFTLLKVPKLKELRVMAQKCVK